MSALVSLFEVLGKTGNWGAFAFGLFGIAVTGGVGYMLKRPIMKQAAENDRFTAMSAGYQGLLGSQEAVIKSQHERIAYLETQERIRAEYEEVLIKRLRDCEERHLRIAM